MAGELCFLTAFNSLDSASGSKYGLPGRSCRRRACMALEPFSSPDNRPLRLENQCPAVLTRSPGTFHQSVRSNARTIKGRKISLLRRSRRIGGGKRGRPGPGFPNCSLGPCHGSPDWGRALLTCLRKVSAQSKNSTSVLPKRNCRNIFRCGVRRTGQTPQQGSSRFAADGHHWPSQKDQGAPDRTRSTSEAEPPAGRTGHGCRLLRRASAGCARSQVTRCPHCPA